MRSFVPVVAALMLGMLAAPAVASAFEPCCEGDSESEGDCGECSDCACCAGARAFPIEPGVLLDAPAVALECPFGASATPPAGEPREVLHVPKRA